MKLEKKKKKKKGGEFRYGFMLFVDKNFSFVYNGLDVRVLARNEDW